MMTISSAGAIVEVDAAEDRLGSEALVKPLDPDGGRRRFRHGSTEPMK